MPQRAAHRPTRSAWRTFTGIVALGLLAACSSASSGSARPPSGSASAGPSSGTPTSTAPPDGLTVTNLDELPTWPMPDRMVFSRIERPADAREAMHETGTTRLGNSSDRKIKVTALHLSGPYRLAATPKLPATLKPGGHLDLTVRFTATTGAAKGAVKTGSLQIRSNAPGSGPNPTIVLTGWWQKVFEHNLEQNDPAPGWSYRRLILTTPSGYRLALEGGRE